MSSHERVGRSACNRRVSRGVCVLALALAVATGTGLGGALPAAASAETCANAEFRTGPSEQLADCRAYEQVSPVEKNGYNAVYPSETQAVQASPASFPQPSAVAYNGISAFPGSPSGDLFDSYLGSRGPSGWQTTIHSPPTPLANPGPAIPVTYNYSTDLSQVVIGVPLQKLTPNAPAGVENLFLRHSDGSYSLVTAAPPSKPIPPGCVNCYEQQDRSTFAGASSDFTHVLFEAEESLTAGAPAAPLHSLYESVAEHVSLVGVLPDGAIAPGGAEPGSGISVPSDPTAAGDVNHAISADGSRILFRAASDGGAPGEQGQTGLTELYARVNGSSTVELSAPAPGAQPGAKCKPKAAEKVCRAGAAQFWAASADGSQVFFTSKAALTESSNTGKEAKTSEEAEKEPENPGNDLYRYTVGAKEPLSDLTVDTKTKDPSGANVLGVVGSSTDGSYVYFVATGQLAGANGEVHAPEAGKPNLYVWHGAPGGAGTVSFIATLKDVEFFEHATGERTVTGPGDSQDWTSLSTQLTAYVTPDGGHLAFTSLNPLTGYDNRDQRTGQADTQVFEYSASTGALACASCDASGARPLGDAFIDQAPASTVLPATSVIATPFHQPRTLSDDGSRLFFSSPDPLVSESVSQQVKVFEYENGVVHLISSGTNGAPDTFLDASASGDDVFFASGERLAPSDQDGLIDVYDARVNGGLAPPPTPSPACVASGCQPPPSAPPSFASPISSSLVGAGNLAPPGPAAVGASRTTKGQLLARALAKCKKVKNKRKRDKCIRAARKRYSGKGSGKRRGKGGRGALAVNHGRRGRS